MVGAVPAGRGGVGEVAGVGRLHMGPWEGGGGLSGGLAGPLHGGDRPGGGVLARFGLAQALANICYVRSAS